MFSKIKIANVVMVLVLLVGGCGVAIVRPVEMNTHKRPTFSMAKINRIAVLEVQKTASSAADIMAMRLMDSGFNVIERARIKDVLKETNIQLSHDEDVKNAAEIGNILDADSILIISISDMTSGQQMIPGGCTTPARIESVVAMGVTARLVDVKTSEVIWVGAASTQDKSMQVCLTRICDDLISSIRR